MAFYFKPRRSNAVNKTIRFPYYLLKEIESITNKENSTFSAFVIQACIYAINNMNVENTSKNKTLSKS